MATIGIEGLIFHGYHGVFKEEAALGGRYEVSVYLEAGIDQAAETDAVRHTVDYGAVYAYVAQEMARPRKLIETLAHGLAQGLLARFALAESVRVRVVKFSPPVGGVCERAFVDYTF